MLPFTRAQSLTSPQRRTGDSLPAGTCKSLAIFDDGTHACRQGPIVRIQLPPADSPSLARIRFRRSRTPAFRAGVRGWLGCDGCDGDFRPARPWSRFCCPAFRLRAHRRLAKSPAEIPP